MARVHRGPPPAERGDKEASRAITEYKIVDYAGKKFAWAEMNPLTGRMHQLRVHALALGTPILGDASYGAAFADGFAPQLHLHARRLKIPHPEGGFLTVEAPLPKHMRDSFFTSGLYRAGCGAAEAGYRIVSLLHFGWPGKRGMSAAMLRRAKFSLLLLAAGLLARDAGAADPVPYVVQLAPSGDAELDALLQQTASLVTLQKKLPAAPFALIGRAQADQAQFLIVLHSLGYDAGHVDMTIDGQALDDPNLIDTLNQGDGEYAGGGEGDAPQGCFVSFGGCVVHHPCPAVSRRRRKSAPVMWRARRPFWRRGPALLTALHNAGYALCGRRTTFWRWRI